MRNKRFTEVFQQYHRLIFKIVVEKVGDFNTTEEICQQVFLSFYKNMDRVKDDMVKSWLFITARNETIDCIRKRQIRSGTASYEHLGNLSAVEEPMAEYVVNRMVNEDFTFRILKDLREKNRSWFDIIMAISILEMEQEEAAEYLGISYQMLRAKLYRARKYIRKKYGEEYLRL